MSTSVEDEPVLTVEEFLERLPVTIVPSTPLYIEAQDIYVEVVEMKAGWIGDRRALILKTDVLLTEPEKEEEEEEEDEETNGPN